MDYGYELSPTVVPYADFDARADAEVLQKAVDASNGTCNSNTVISILANRTNSQRQEIAAQFKDIYEKDLLASLKTIARGKFTDLLVAMMTPLHQYYAKELHASLSQIGQDESVFIEILCTLPKEEIDAVKEAYLAMYERTLEDDLLTNALGDFKRLVVSLYCAIRETFTEPRPEPINNSVRYDFRDELNRAYNEHSVSEYLVKHSRLRMNDILNGYEERTGRTLGTVLQKGIPEETQRGLTAVEKCAKNRAKFIAARLYKRVKCHRQFTRLIVTRCEIDLEEIKRIFLHEYCERLESFIADRCSGYYARCLHALASSDLKN